MDLFVVPQNGPRAHVAAVETISVHSRRIRLARVARQRRRCAGSALPQNAGTPGTGTRDARASAKRKTRFKTRPNCGGDCGRLARGAQAIRGGGGGFAGEGGEVKRGAGGNCEQIRRIGASGIASARGGNPPTPEPTSVDCTTTCRRCPSTRCVRRRGRR